MHSLWTNQTWATRLEEGEYTIALIMDQSMTFNIVDHSILLNKNKMLGLDQHSMQVMQSYLEDRTQTVYLEGFTSDSLHIGARSVVQGSALSCVLFLVFTLDLPLIFDNETLTVEQEDNTARTNSYRLL